MKYKLDKLKLFLRVIKRHHLMTAFSEKNYNIIALIQIELLGVLLNLFFILPEYLFKLLFSFLKSFIFIGKDSRTIKIFINYFI